MSILVGAREAFAQRATSPMEVATALEHLTRWSTHEEFADYRLQIQAMGAEGRWDALFDAFVRDLPFGTGGLRGPVGLGPNRINRRTTARTVQGHCAFLLSRTDMAVKPKVVIAYDVRQFQDFRSVYISGVNAPIFGLTSRQLAECAAEVYACNGIDVLIQPRTDDRFLSTPELSHAVRFYGAQGGLNVSASHNPPDDNGLKFYNHHGGQFVPPFDAQLTRYVQAVDSVKQMAWDEAVSLGVVQWLSEDAYDAYIALVAAQSSGVETAEPIVFTGLHGAGTWSVPPVLRAAGFIVHEEPKQRQADGSFATVPGRAPNPEIPACMEMGIDFAKRIGSTIVLGTDPDADRIGVAVQHGEEWHCLTGNEIASLVVYQALNKHPNPKSALVMKTEVTTRLVSLIGGSFGAKVVDNLLVGFKYIGDGLQQFESTGRFAGVNASATDFCVGVEESHGILTTSAIRDKDAAGGALLIVECAMNARRQGQSLVDVLHQLRKMHGCVLNRLTSTVMQGAAGRQRIQNIMQSLRESPPNQVGTFKITEWTDHQDESGPWGTFKSDTDKASRNVLVFNFGHTARVIIRPSGTEPKCKVYGECMGEDPAVTLSQLELLMEQFLDEMLSRVDIRMASWGHSLSDQLTIEAKCAFVQNVFPRLMADAQKGHCWSEHQLDSELNSIGISDVRWIRSGVRRWMMQNPLSRPVQELLGVMT